MFVRWGCGNAVGASIRISRMRCSANSATRTNSPTKMSNHPKKDKLVKKMFKRRSKVVARITSRIMMRSKEKSSMILILLLRFQPSKKPKKNNL